MGASLGGVLAFSRASLNNPNGEALLAGRLTAGQGMHCRDGFTANGEVNIVNAHIGGVLVFDDARLANPGGFALWANGVIVDRGMSCAKGFTAYGKVSLVGARIAGRLDFRGASFHNRDGLHGLALDLEAAHTSELYLLPKEAPDAAVELTNAHVGSFHDEPATWPSKLLLRGFVYDRLENDSVSVSDRLCWLAKDPSGYLPQLYEQLADVYRKAGREDDARRSPSPSNVTAAKLLTQLAKRGIACCVGRSGTAIRSGGPGYGLWPWSGWAGGSSTAPTQPSWLRPSHRDSDLGSTLGCTPWTFWCPSLISAIRLPGFQATGYEPAMWRGIWPDGSFLQQSLRPSPV
jgi:hypothetical protein